MSCLFPKGSPLRSTTQTIGHRDHNQKVRDRVPFRKQLRASGENTVDLCITFP